MNIEETDKEISKYIEDNLKSKRAFGRLGSGLQRAISSKILREIQGMFLVAKLQLERLERIVGKGSRENDILPILESWPQGVFGVYEKMLSDIPQTCQEELRRALLLVCFSKVPVTLAETAEFATLEPGNSAPSPADRFSDPEDLLRLSGSLFANSQTRLFLSHHSIQEYLLSDHIRASSARFFALDEHVAAESIFHSSVAYPKGLDAENSLGSYEVLPSTGHSSEHFSIQRLKHDYPLANLSSLQFISAPPVYLERYKDDVEVVLTSQRCLAYGFWWILCKQESFRNLNLNREPAPGSVSHLRMSRQGSLYLAWRLFTSILYDDTTSCLKSKRAGVHFQQLATKPGGFPLPNGPHPHDIAILRTPDGQPAMLALGIILLEIELGRTLESVETQSLENSRDMAAAPDLHHTTTQSFISQDSRAAQYSRAIQLCFSSSTDSMTEEDVQILYQGAFQPLEGLVAVYKAFDQNMRLLQLAEVPE
ncbi:ankyrin repeat protein [Phlyctema vagabunda]|uniref:Ankyrin repeat protein n=1 Tax=Phlyctema vagabunda TaxID=108571 RepID=A0ABR4PU04_9HELO